MFFVCLLGCLFVSVSYCHANYPPQLSVWITFFSLNRESPSGASCARWLLIGFCVHILFMSMATALSEQTSLTRSTLPFPLLNTHAAYLMIHCWLVLGWCPLKRLLADLQSIWLTGMASHPPIPIMDLADHLERLKANDNLKFSQEYEVSVREVPRLIRQLL